MLQIDTHAPGYLRANVNVQQFQEFYDAFGVEEATGCTSRRRKGSPFGKKARAGIRMDGGGRNVYTIIKESFEREDA